MKIYQSNYKIELTQEELNTIIIVLGQSVEQEVINVARGLNVRVVDNVQELYDQMSKYEV